jgi:hypothetical protein
MQEYSSTGSPSGWSVDFPAGNRNTNKKEEVVCPFFLR